MSNHNIARWTLGIRTCIKSRASTSQQRCPLHLPSVPLPSFTSFTSAFNPTASDMSGKDSKSFVFRIKWDQLMDSLSREDANPSRVWNAYLELGRVMGFEKLPFDVQQQVLRKSVPETKKLRYALARRMQAGNRPSTPHIYESRLQTVIGHIRESGRKPELEDYNFVLEQFAAVGHQSGARMVFQELTEVIGVEPSFKTYGLCLQAIAHRLTLPCPYRYQSAMLTEASRMCTELLDDMWQRRIPLTSVNFDLVHRIFKETSDRSTFEKLLRVGYGIDLAYPDRPLLELQGPGILTGVTDIEDFKNFKPLPFSTAALNTLIDMLGRTKQVSRMVMAYEVLTAPLPTTSDSSSVQSTDDDDDIYQFSTLDGDRRLPVYPSAMPNTTTFSMLIRYAAKANHTVFTRHYIFHAMIRDRETDAQLRADLASKPLEQILSPNFAVNRSTFLPPYGMANRERHFAFIRWCYDQTRVALQRKKDDLAFYTSWRKEHMIVSKQESDKVNGETNRTPHSSQQSVVMPQLPEALLIDLDAPPPPPKPIHKPFNIDRHISLLARDVEELGDLIRRMQDGVRRLSQRVKERLGRRVWQGKNIFLMSHNARVYLGRREWVQRVGFVTPRKRSTLHPSQNEHRYSKRTEGAGSPPTYSTTVKIS